MKVRTFNDKIEEQVTILEKELLEPYYRKGNVKELAQRFDEAECVDTLIVDCPDFSLDFKLKTDEHDPHSTDYENVVTLHTAMKNLPPAIAANPNFWAWEAHDSFSEYIHNRSEKKRTLYNETSVLRDFFCRIETGVIRSLVVNPLSRLWWAGHLLYDNENTTDPYHFLRLFTSSAFNSKLVQVASSAVARNHEITMGMMDAIEKFKTVNGILDITRKDEIFVKCTRHLNSIGAVRMIDTLGRNTICEICYNELSRAFGKG